MRFLIVIGIVFAQLFFSFGADSPSAIGKTPSALQYKVQVMYSKANMPLQQAGKGRRPYCQFVPASFKMPKYGPNPVAAILSFDSLKTPGYHHNNFLTYFSPSYLPLQMLLLFPNHFFW